MCCSQQRGEKMTQCHFEENQCLWIDIISGKPCYFSERSKTSPPSVAQHCQLKSVAGRTLDGDHGRSWTFDVGGQKVELPLIAPRFYLSSTGISPLTGLPKTALDHSLCLFAQAVPLRCEMGSGPWIPTNRILENTSFLFYFRFDFSFYTMSCVISMNSSIDNYDIWVITLMWEGLVLLSHSGSQSATLYKKVLQNEYTIQLKHWKSKRKASADFRGAQFLWGSLVGSIWISPFFQVFIVVSSFLSMHYIFF